MSNLTFDFSGGIQKYPTERLISKFLLFHLIKDPVTGKVAEKLLFKSIRDGNAVDNRAFVSTPMKAYPKQDPERFQTSDPFLKVFTLISGFGVSKQFYSFFFLLDIHESLTTILPLCTHSQDYYFLGRGRFMLKDEIKTLLGEESVSYAFYTKQAPLPIAVLRRIVLTGKGQEAGLNPATSKVRRIRL